MTISSTIRKAGPFSGTGAQTVYPFTFKVFTPGDMLVVLTDAGGIETVQTLTTHYTVALNTDQNVSPGGTITMLVAPPAGYLLTVGSVVQPTQGQSIPNMGGFYPKVIENALDKLTISVQQIAESAARSFKLAFSDTGSPNLPAAAARANKLLSFDVDGNPVAVAANPGSATELQFQLASAVGTTLVKGTWLGGVVANISAFATSAGSSLIGFIQTGAGAVLRSIQDKLRAMLIDRADFGTQGQFDTAAAAAPTIPTLDGNGNYGAKITPFAESTQLDLKSALLSVAVGPRDALIYRTATSVTVSRKFAVMGGFRYRGQYTRGRAPVFPMPASTAANCTGTGLGAETAFRTENWYAAFACANAGDAAAVIKTMPFLRVSSVAGNIVSLNKAGEGIHAVAAQTYAWNAVDNLVGTECLVISEGGAWSGRVTTITSNGAGYVELANVGALAFGDFLLPAPPGKAHYVYLASFYMDTAELRNIYDAGSLVKAKMIYLLKGKTLGGVLTDYANGAFDAGSASLMMNCQGYISPLATAVVLDSSATLSTTAVGDSAEYFDVDGGSHIVHSAYYTKNSANAETHVFPGVQVPFIYHQLFNWSTGGSLSPQRINSKLNITGWIET